MLRVAAFSSLLRYSRYPRHDPFKRFAFLGACDAFASFDVDIEGDASLIFSRVVIHEVLNLLGRVIMVDIRYFFPHLMLSLASRPFYDIKGSHKSRSILPVVLDECVA